MSIAKKGKRKLVHDSRIYFWHIIDDGYQGSKEIQIISEDKKTIISFNMLKNSEIVICKSECFERNFKINFSTDTKSISPKSIIEIIDCVKIQIRR